MRFLILDVYPNNDWRLVKNIAGGYGTGNDLSKKNCYYYIDKISKSSSKSQNKKLQNALWKKSMSFFNKYVS